MLLVVCGFNYISLFVDRCVVCIVVVGCCLCVVGLLLVYYRWTVFDVLSLSVAHCVLMVWCFVVVVVCCVLLF